MTSNSSSKLSFEGHNFDLPILHGTLGPDVIDVNKLGRQGIFTIDPGYVSTASCESKITFIDGAEGILLYRGYPIDQLAEQCDFMEVCHLLLLGELPSAAQKQDFVHSINYHTLVHEQINHFLNGFRRDAHPMAIMVGVVGCAVSVLSRLTRHR